MTKQIQETYIHEVDGIKVGVLINYRKKTISLIDNDTLKRKQWLFAERGLEFMKSWKRIFNAMTEAVELAEEKLQAYVDEETEELVALACAIEETGRTINNERE